MEWISIIGLIVFGIFLLIVEIIFVPGTTIVGIGGLICLGFGTYLGFEYFGPAVGTSILVFSGLATIGSLIYAFKSDAWERFSLKDENTGRYNDEIKLNLSVGDKGKTISSLKPIGKAIFEDQIIEVRSDGNFIKENTEIEIRRIESTKIFVEPIT